MAVGIMLLSYVTISLGLVAFDRVGIAVDPSDERGGGIWASVAIGFMWPLWLMMVGIVGMGDLLDWLIRSPGGEP